MFDDPGRDLPALLRIMAHLRDPDGGCPWDLEQSFETIAPYTLEEAYEVDDAIARGDLEDLCEELGDLLLQVVYHARMAEEQGAFRFEDVVRGVCEKLVRRHPHVFGDARIEDAESQVAAWEEHKARERRERRARRAQASEDGGGSAAPEASVLDGVPTALPALARADKLQSRGRRVGIREEASAEPLARDFEARAGDASQRLGALLWDAVALARTEGIDAEAALRGENRRREARLRRREGESRR